MGAPLIHTNGEETHDGRLDLSLTQRDPFGPVGTLLGYVIAVLAVAILFCAVRLLLGG